MATKLRFMFPSSGTTVEQKILIMKQELYDAADTLGWTTGPDDFDNFVNHVKRFITVAKVHSSLLYGDMWDMWDLGGTGLVTTSVLSYSRLSFTPETIIQHTELKKMKHPSKHAHFQHKDHAFQSS
eukprot:scaffold32301_cov71-Attheya_sp.AAC.1